MGVWYYLEFFLSFALCGLHANFLYAGYQDTLANGIGGTLQRPSFNELIGVRVGDFSVPAALPVFYLIFVYFAHWLLPLVFKSKDAYPRLAGATDAYNIYSSVLSLIMFALFVREFVVWGSRGPFTLRYSAKTHTNAWAAAMWLNYQSKFVEYADTAFILFKGSADKQLSHLHVIHHAEMGPLMYLFCSVTAGGQSAFGPMINSCVHFFMYLYYLFSNKPYVLSEGAKRAIKPCVTGLQIAQFVVILLHSTFHCLQPNRYWPFTLAIVQTLLMFQMLWMFSDFFVKSYGGGGGKGKRAAGTAPSPTPSAPPQPLTAGDPQKDE